MKEYQTDTIDTCWNDSLACLLEIPPKRVPNFLKLYRKEYMEKTREWLADNFGKGLVFIPARAFMETGKTRYNSPIGPTGLSIIIFNIIRSEKRHAAIAYNGGVLWDNGDSREDEYENVVGYFVLYDLHPSRPKAIKKQRDAITRKKKIKKK